MGKRKPTHEQTGRARRLAGCELNAREIAEAVGCTVAFAARCVRERNERMANGTHTWADRGELQPPEARTRNHQR